MYLNELLEVISGISGDSFMAMPFLWATELVSFWKLSPRNKNAQTEIWISLSLF